MEVQNKDLFQPDINKLTTRERAVISYWRYTWKCKCGSSGIRLTTKNRANKNKRQHLRQSKKGCKSSEVEVMEVER